MRKEETESLANRIAEELCTLPEGSETTSGRLLRKYGGMKEELSEEEMLAFHEALFRAAREKGLVLDTSRHEFRLEGLPWNLDFAVRRSKAKRKTRFDQKNRAFIDSGLSPCYDGKNGNQIEPETKARRKGNGHAD